MTPTWQEKFDLNQISEVGKYVEWKLTSQKEKIIEKIEAAIKNYEIQLKQAGWDDTYRSLEDTLLGLKEAISIIKEQV